MGLFDWVKDVLAPTVNPGTPPPGVPEPGVCPSGGLGWYELVNFENGTVYFASLNDTDYSASYTSGGSCNGVTSTNPVQFAEGTDGIKVFRNGVPVFCAVDNSRGKATSFRAVWCGEVPGQTHSYPTGTPEIQEAGPIVPRPPALPVPRVPLPVPIPIPPLPIPNPGGDGDSDCCSCDEIRSIVKEICEPYFKKVLAKLYEDEERRAIFLGTLIRSGNRYVELAENERIDVAYLSILNPIPPVSSYPGTPPQYRLGVFSFGTFDYFEYPKYVGFPTTKVVNVDPLTNRVFWRLQPNVVAVLTLIIAKKVITDPLFIVEN